MCPRVAGQSAVHLGAAVGGDCARAFLMHEQRELLLAARVPFCSVRQKEGIEWGLLEGSIYNI